MDTLRNLIADWRLGRMFRLAHEANKCGYGCVMCIREALDALDAQLLSRKVKP